jgi:hypothetical protein
MVPFLSVEGLSDGAGAVVFGAASVKRIVGMGRIQRDQRHSKSNVGAMALVV